MSGSTRPLGDSGRSNEYFTPHDDAATGTAVLGGRAEGAVFSSESRRPVRREYWDGAARDGAAARTCGTLYGNGKIEGGRLATGGRRPSHLDRGYYFEPTVFCNVSNSSVIAREEVFGPVVSVIPAETEEEALAIANDSPFGLNSSVFTNDVDRAYACARQIRAGTVGHNGVRHEQHRVWRRQTVRNRTRACTFCVGMPKAPVY